jgi:hypothetical protein
MKIMKLLVGILFAGIPTKIDLQKVVERRW